MNSKTTCLLTGLALITTAFGRTIPNFAEADLVLGQTDFTSKLLPTPPTGTSLLVPVGVVVDPITRKVFVADALNNRILRYADANTLANGAPAEFVLGQLSFVAKTDFAANGIRAVGLYLDRRGRLWVADPTRHRVLMFEAASSRTNWIADKIFGQPDAATVTRGTVRGKMDGPYDLCVDSADRLWVADLGNNRVLRFDAVSGKGSGALPDGVLGQPDFTTQDPATTRRGQQFASWKPFVDGVGSLWLPDSSLGGGGKNRVLRYPAVASLPISDLQSFFPENDEL